MRNIIYLLQRHSTFFVFLFLELICITLIVKNNSYQHSSFINSTKSLTGGLFKKREKLKEYFLLTEINKQLKEENTELKNKLGIPIAKNNLKDTSYSSEIVLNDSTKQTVYYAYKPATVINNIIDQPNNYLTLDIGSKQGVSKNNSVLSSKGVVGKIVHVSNNYSICASIISSKFFISSELKDGTVGKISWDTKDIDYVTLSGIPQHVNIMPGDSVYTSSYSGLFPKKILIGRAAAILKGGTSGLNNYKIKLATNFRNLHFVYIVKDNTTLEQQLLEDSVKNIP